jgi:hypothetical protein
MGESLGLELIHSLWFDAAGQRIHG